MATRDYGDTSIKTLDPVTHIRMRPGMYVGEPGTGAMYHDCIYILMKEVIDNSIDEFFKVRSFREGEFSEAYFAERRRDTCTRPRASPSAA